MLLPNAGLAVYQKAIWKASWKATGKLLTELTS